MAKMINSQSPPQDAEFWLPSKFLSDESHRNHSSFKLFPAEFPYDLDSPNNSALSSPLDESTTESDSSSSDEDDFFAALTRRFAQTTTPKLKPEAVITSPQSTLTGMRSSWSADGSPNGPSQVTSPPATPFAAAVDNDTWELIYAAAGQVARLKLASSRNLLKFNQIPNPQGRGLLGNPTVRNHHPNSFVQFGAAKPPVPGQQWVRQGQMGHFHQIQCQNRVRNGSSGGGCVYENVGSCGGRPSMPQLTRPVPVPVPGIGPGMVNGSGVKKECAGTGVFLPRRYSNPPEPRKKTAGCPNVVLPAKVVQALNLSFEDMNFNGHSHPRFGCGFSPDYEALLARRNALLEQQRRSLRAEGALNHEVRLPQEWTY